LFLNTVLKETVYIVHIVIFHFSSLN